MKAEELRKIIFIAFILTGCGYDNDVKSGYVLDKVHETRSRHSDYFGLRIGGCNEITGVADTTWVSVTLDTWNNHNIGDKYDPSTRQN